MGERTRLLASINLILGRFGYQTVPTRTLYEWQRRPAGRSFVAKPVPKEAEEYLTPENPRFQDLVERYANADPRVTEPLTWTAGYVTPDDLRYFRGDNPYVWQLRGRFAEIHYVLTTYYVKDIDRLGLLEKLAEDGAFGAYTFPVDGKAVSRDLLDSILHLDFLDRHLGLSKASGLNILDIGAGYGRLANRTLEALPDLGTYYCTDAVASSTFLSEYYLKFRGIGDSGRVVALDRLEELDMANIGLAINIHSFSECRLSAVVWWVELLARLSVKYLMIVPNAQSHGGNELLTNTGDDFLPVIEAQGYKLVAKEPKYRDPSVQKYGLFPSYHYLFELSS